MTPPIRQHPDAFRADRRIAVDPRVTIAYRDIAPAKCSRHLPILLIHAWPLAGATYRRLVAELAEYRCLVPDSPGLGDSLVPPGTPLGARDQARYFRAFVDALGVDRFHLVAHDTGAISARLLAVELGARVASLTLFDTEIPGERPPVFGWATKVAGLPGAGFMYRQLLRWPRFVWSDIGLGAGYADNVGFRGELTELFLAPLLADPIRFANMMAYGRQVDWSLVDALRDLHPRITAPVKLIWGADDPLFLVAGARRMMSQFRRCEGIEVIARGRLCAYDEFAPEVGHHVRAFISAFEAPAGARADV